jgi:cytoskeletal protein CcmA (bactofilin family)
MAEGSVIGRGSLVRGSVRGDGNLEILGRVEGDVNVTGEVTLGEEALVRGNIAAARVFIAGAVQGDLRGNEAVQVEAGGRVIGDLTSPRIGLAPGALVKGTVRTDGEAPLPAPQRRGAGVGQPLRSASAAPPRMFPAAAAKPEPMKVPVPPPAAPPPPATAEDIEESEPPPPKREAPPPPVVPALGKNAKAKKKKRDG